MPRAIPISAPERGLLDAAAREPFIDIEVAVVTPLFGGGATPRQTDPQQPVRGSSVRGQLRFWWRACQGAAYASVDDLFAAESALWGNTERPSPLQVGVEMLNRGGEIACATFPADDRGGYKSFPRWTPGHPGYALFPFQGKVSGGRIETSPALGREGVRFRLRIADGTDRLSEAERGQVRGAVWAWLTFGGIGARTRRGCGSLYCAEAPFAPPTKPAEVAGWLKAQARGYLAGTQRQLPIPTLPGAAIVFGKVDHPPMSCWGIAVKLMQDFRQGVGFGRNSGSGPNRPGRSRWPEADSIRQLSGTHDPQHAPTHPARPYFPRADLGLPIIFHFQSREDPAEATLEADAAAQASRMASPIILKPLTLGPDRAVALALCLDAPRVWDVAGIGLRLRRPDRAIGTGELHDSEKNNQVTPLTRQGKGVSARKAFMEFAAEQLKTTTGGLR